MMQKNAEKCFQYLLGQDDVLVSFSMVSGNAHNLLVIVKKLQNHFVKKLQKHFIKKKLFFSKIFYVGT